MFTLEFKADTITRHSFQRIAKKLRFFPSAEFQSYVPKLMNTTLIAKLKPLQLERSDKSPFSSHVEFLKWADQVSPILSFDIKLKTSFDQCVLSADVSHNISSELDSVGSINRAIGILNQAVMSLEINTIPNPATLASTGKSNAVYDWYNKPLGQIGIGVVIAIIGLFATYLIQQHLGISL